MKKNTGQYLQFIFRNGIFFSNGEVWQHHRRVLQSSFAQTKFTHLIASAFRELNSKLDTMLDDKEFRTIPVHELLGKY